MVKELVSRSEFARRANVGATAISKGCKTFLAPCCVGAKIDVNHPVAAEYLQSHAPENQPQEPASGIDPLYQAAVDKARELGQLSIRMLKRELHVSTERARELVQLITASKVLDKPPAKPITVNFNSKGRISSIDSTMLGGDKFRNQIEAAAFTLPYQGDEDELPSPSEYPGELIEELGDLTLRELIAKFGTADRFKVWLQARKTLVDIGAKEIVNGEKRKQLIPRAFVETFLIGTFERAHINLMTDGAQNIARRMSAMIKAGSSVEECEIFVSDQVSRHIKEAKASITRVLADV